MKGEVTFVGVDWSSDAWLAVMNTLNGFLETHVSAEIKDIGDVPSSEFEYYPV